jgi:hypothetical protein
VVRLMQKGERVLEGRRTRREGGLETDLLCSLLVVRQSLPQLDSSWILGSLLLDGLHPLRKDHALHRTLDCAEEDDRRRKEGNDAISKPSLSPNHLLSPPTEGKRYSRVLLDLMLSLTLGSRSTSAPVFLASWLNQGWASVCSTVTN